MNSNIKANTYWYDEEYDVYVYVKENSETTYSEVVVSLNPPYISYFTDGLSSLVSSYTPTTKEKFEEAYAETCDILSEAVYE